MAQPVCSSFPTTQEDLDQLNADRLERGFPPVALRRRASKSSSPATTRRQSQLDMLRQRWELANDPRARQAYDLLREVAGHDYQYMPALVATIGLVVDDETDDDPEPTTQRPA